MRRSATVTADVAQRLGPRARDAARGPEARHPTSTATGCTPRGRRPSSSTATTTSCRRARQEVGEPALRARRPQGTALRPRHRRRQGRIHGLAGCRLRLPRRGRRPARQPQAPDRGREEVGSAHLPDFLKTHRSKLDADVLVLSDASNFETGVPALTWQLRGIVQVDVEVTCLERPVHSGDFGGAVPTPCASCAASSTTCVLRDGSIAIPGLYRDVARPTRACGAAWPGCRSPKPPSGATPDAARDEARPRARLLGLRADLDAALADRDRVRGPPLEGAVEPDPGLGAGADLDAHGAEDGLAARRRDAGCESSRPPAGGRAGRRADRPPLALVDDRAEGPRHSTRRCAPSRWATARSPRSIGAGGSIGFVKPSPGAARRAVPAHRCRGPAVRRALREREPPPRRLEEVDARGRAPAGRAVRARVTPAPLACRPPRLAQLVPCRGARPGLLEGARRGLRRARGRVRLLARQRGRVSARARRRASGATTSATVSSRAAPTRSAR